jgi:cytochrome c oxidase cbb3-type subunit 3
MVLGAMAGVFLAVAFLGVTYGAGAQDGKEIYVEKCLGCHGEKGDGKGPMAAAFKPPIAGFKDPKFRQGDVNQKISDSITKGKDRMEPVELKPEEIKAVTEYMNKTFLKK